jgi:hypothetical protein
VHFPICCFAFVSATGSPVEGPSPNRSHKTPYYKALEAADKEWETRKLDLSVLEKLLADLLAQQLGSIHDQATGSETK